MQACKYFHIIAASSNILTQRHSDPSWPPESRRGIWRSQHSTILSDLQQRVCKVRQTHEHSIESQNGIFFIWTVLYAKCSPRYNKQIQILTLKTKPTVLEPTWLELGRGPQDIAYKQHNELRTVRFHIKNPKEKEQGEDHRKIMVTKTLN